MLEQQVLISCWRHREVQKQTDSSPTKFLITLTESKRQNFSPMTLSIVNVAAATHLMQNTKSMLFHWKVDWRRNELSPIWNYKSHNLPGLRTINTCKKKGSRNKWAHWKTFCVRLRIKMLIQLWKSCRKWLLFIMIKISICWSFVVF